MPEATRHHRVVIVGGGAGGLELATRLGDTLGRKGLADITLVDAARTHLWKPLLYEVAAGTLDSYADQLEYLAQARWHHFRFRVGRMYGLDRASKEVLVAATLDEAGAEITPNRRIPYDTLVIAVGSLAHDFGIPGVKDHCVMLDTPEQARAFHDQLINACLRAHNQPGPIEPGLLTVAIVGGGATGVELAAELHGTARQLPAYGLERIDPDKDVRIVVIEAADRMVPGLPPRLSQAVEERMRELGIELHTGERVTGVDADGLSTGSGLRIPARMMVWAAGIKAPDFLAGIDGLETNRVNQLVVRPTLQTTLDDDIFAFGDCAACPMPGTEANVPPRAQAAHQQANTLAKSIRRRLRGEALPEYVYRDYGSLVVLGRYSTVGSLMGALTGGSVMVEGIVARLVYWSLYKLHQVTLNGYFKTVLSTLANLINSPNKPTIKLH
ncbi:NAD(P)/FAD-dependent oxidoreductase [Parasulfuritortus cantonensis]|uniref:NAD(P)/FAD-dependent oxidoreductase n=1 Tax=Parasulfuritortus cantonensis TaxID=2528202 RepID=A0A4V2NV31_9PROT|nr:NAD(P)/FAD-dependent oxidoreductase [Parasulfuritortus cantonensis]TCJ11916.1 NAD(P)/FAD-dependent oxidoreductase [Parasulfuritortus cantonensis]